MAITFRAVGTQVNTANNVANPSTLVTSAPAGRVYGDLLLLITNSRSNTATVATPGGWTLCTGFPVASGTASGGTFYCFKRVADGTTADNASPVWTGLTTGTSGDSASARILAYQGAGTTQDGTVTSSDAASTTTITMPSITTAVNNSIVIGMAMRVHDTAHTFTVATRSERSDAHTTTGTGHGTVTADVIQATAGASGTATVTPSNTTSQRTLAVSIAFAEVVPLTTSVAEVSLDPISTPRTRTQHWLRIRGRYSSGGTLGGTFRMRLYEGASTRGAELETSQITSSLANYSIALPDADAATITDYSNLSMRFRGYSAFGGAATFEVSEIWIETPPRAKSLVTDRRSPRRNYLLRR